MKRFVAMSIRARVCVLATLTVACLTAGAMPATASAACGSGPGSCSQTDVNNAIEHGVSYLDANQNPTGSWGTTDPGAETALALASYGVLDGGNFNTLSAARKTIVEKGLTFLLGTQSTVNGSFAGDGLQTYDTGIALIALSLSSNVPTTPAGAVAPAIANARAYLVGQQQVPPQISCQSTGASGSGLGGQNFCGGWNYTTGSFGRSDESNTGFALTGLDVTGGVPAAVAAANAGWQRNVQQLTNNPGGFPARNDGGGAYEPGIPSGDFSSNANDTGSLLFGYGYDKVPASDPGVKAAIKFGTDVLNTYELNKSTRTMVFHTGQNEDGSCVIGAAGCDWAFGTGEGGYHYSLFALVKGLSQYITPNLTDTTNFYAKAADVLIGQQGTDGSWPADLRDDASTIGATGFAILALGKVGIPVFPITAQAVPVSATEGQSFTGQVATFTVKSTTASASGYSASINWGDGHTTTGTIAGSAGSFTVTGTHTYAEEGSYKTAVTITDVNTPSNKGTASATATVKDAALHATAAKPNSSGLTVSGTFAKFTDDDPNGALSDYTASINWGDGHSSSGSISGGSQPFGVTASHTYSKGGTFTITVTIKDAGGSSATVTLTVTVAAKTKAKHVVHGAATLRGAPQACVLMPFRMQVRGKQIASVTWSVDGHRISGKTMRKGNQYASEISISPGKHTLTVKVTFKKSSHTHARTFHRTVSGCPLVSPVFTG
jgi:hypothetical protein